MYPEADGERANLIRNPRLQAPFESHYSIEIVSD
jgi:hypothetical protein